MGKAHLRDSKEILGNLDNIAQRLDVLNPDLDSLGMPLPSRVQNVLELLNRSITPFLVHRTTIPEDTIEYSEQTESSDRFLVQHVELIADCPDGDACSGRENRGLGGEGVAGKGLDDGLGALLWVFGGDVGLVSLLRDWCCEGGEVSRCEGWSEFGCACKSSLVLLMLAAGVADRALLTDSASGESGRHCQ